MSKMPSNRLSIGCKSLKCMTKTWICMLADMDIIFVFDATLGGLGGHYGFEVATAKALPLD